MVVSLLFTVKQHDKIAHSCFFVLPASGDRMSTFFPVTVLNGTRCAQQSNRTAAVLAIGTSNPVNCVSQDEYADWYFRVTKSEHLAKLKDKMKRICS